MKNFVIGSVFAIAASQAAGCVIEDDTCDPAVENCGTTDYATVGATWTVRTINNPSIPCPPNGTTAALFNQRVDGSGNPVGTCAGPNNISNDCFIDLYNCEDKAGTSAPLPPARYLTWIALTNDTGSQVYAKSLSAYLDVTNVDLTFNASIYDDGGYFLADWNLVAQSNSSALSCSAAGASFVAATVSAGNTLFDTNPWACEDHYGVTSVIPEAANAYSVTFEALNSSQASLTTDTAGSTFQNESITGPNGFNDLGSVNIKVDGF